MANYKFRVGDVVRIREWDDMEREYGLTEYGDIRVHDGVVFLSSMRELCGCEFKIENIQAEPPGLDQVLKLKWAREETKVFADTFLSQHRYQTIIPEMCVLVKGAEKESWRAGSQEDFWYIDFRNMEIKKASEYFSDFSKCLWQTGNYFKTKKETLDSMAEIYLEEWRKD